MELGYLTPPVGLNLFISSYRFNKPITDVYLATVPFLLILLLSVLLIIFVPQISLWLVN
jgi:TRAP-type C4-dicarboxylate transport system permease large subunit